MVALTANQVASVVRQVGPPLGSTVAEWVAKARQENAGFDTEIENGVHVGLWQIDYELHAGKAGTSKDPQTARGQLKNPWYNMNVAKELFNESGWRPWNASGGKPSPTAEDRAAADNPDSLITGQPDILDKAAAPFADVVDALSAIVEVIGDGAGWVSDRKNWGRIVFVGIGAVVIVTALGVIAKPVVSDTMADLKGNTRQPPATSTGVSA